MELKLPLIVTRLSARFVRCWVPGFSKTIAEGPSLSELKDDLSLEVMLAFEAEQPAEAWRWQLAPHLKLKQVKLEATVRDQKDGFSASLVGKLGVLLEKWPDDAFWVATPTRASYLRFPLLDPEQLGPALERRVIAYCLEHRIETLEGWHTTHDQRLDVLELEADAPTVLPRRSAPVRARKKKKASPTGEDVEAPETPAQREQRRTRARLSVRTLRTIGKNLSHLARDSALGRAQGREAIVSQLVDTLERRSGAAIALVGPGGVGKTAIVHEVTHRLAQRELVRRDVWRTDGNQFIAGMSYVGQWEARARELCTELVDTGDVLFVDDLASLVFAGRHAKGETHLAMYLEPSIARRELTLIGECSPERFERLREEAPSFAAQFDVIQVPAMTEAEALPVLLSTVRALEDEAISTTPRIAPDVMQLALELSGRFFSTRALPGRAVRLLEQVLAGEGTLDGRVRRYRAKDVFEAVRRETGLPDFVLGAAPPRSRSAIVAALQAQVAGQPEAIDAVADAVLALQASLQDPEKPLANYLFVGPTGVGKTELAKALARLLFGADDRLVRFDMSELSGPGAMQRLIGTTGGAEGELITALKTQPFCVVLFDEIEKAHPRVFDALLQFLGEGRLSDETGRLADGRRCVVVMTSNLGVREAASQTGFARGDVEAATQHYLAAARAFFRPELFNRLDRVVPFRSLDKPALRLVVEHALGDLLRRRGLQRGNVLVDVEPELLSLLVDQAYDPRYGARPLKRALERKLAVPLAHHLVRRSGDELALVELLRRGDEPALSVQLLRPASPVSVDDQLEWNVERLRLAANRARETVRVMLDSNPLGDLRQRRSRALAASTAISAGAELIDGLEAIRSELDAVLERLEPEQYDERVTAPHKRYSAPWRAPKRNRPDAFVQGVQYAINTEATIDQVAPTLAQLLDRLTVLEHRLASVVDERVTVIVEAVGAPVSAAAMNVFVSSLPLVGDECFEGTGDWRGDPAATQRRRAITFSGPGVRGLLEPWLGYARVDDQGHRALLRCLELLPAETSDVRASLLAWSEATAAAREARRRGEPGPAAIDGVVVLEQIDGVGRFVSTGLGLQASQRHLASCLRARGGR